MIKKIISAITILLINSHCYGANPVFDFSQIVKPSDNKIESIKEKALDKFTKLSSNASKCATPLKIVNRYQNITLPAGTIICWEKSGVDNYKIAYIPNKNNHNGFSRVILR